jgi:hypothetical protein
MIPGAGLVVGRFPQAQRSSQWHLFVTVAAVAAAVGVAFMAVAVKYSAQRKAREKKLRSTALAPIVIPLGYAVALTASDRVLIIVLGAAAGFIFVTMLVVSFYVLRRALAIPPDRRGTW